jgi:hypothetical protein
MHDNWLMGNYTAAKAALVQELHTNITNTLANVAGIIANLQKLNTVGMPAKSLNAFAFAGYPLQTCDGTTTAASATAATSQSMKALRAMLKGDGLLPLPLDATPVPPPPRMAGATKAMPTTDGPATPTTGMAAQGSSPAGDATMGAAPVPTAALANATMSTGNRKLLL